MHVKNPSLSAPEVMARLRMDEHGRLFWIKGCGNARPGEQAGRLIAGGYRQISIGGRKYLAHRIVWLLTTGEWPAEYIDHINGEKDDNRPSNLRVATPLQNSWNRRDVAGVTLHKGTGKYQVQFRRDGKTFYIGLFASRDAARVASEKAALELFGEWRQS
jgi:hypothetical protein